VPLIPQAVEVLERRREKVESEYIFPSESATGHLGTIKKSWAKLLQRAGIENAVPHDLRRSVAQAALDAGADFAVVSALLGHSRSSLGTTGIYAAPSLERQRATLERGVVRLLGGESEADVVPFAAR
jgi:integrase